MQVIVWVCCPPSSRKWWVCITGLTKNSDEVYETQRGVES